jgi:hypothetical protein
MKSKMCLKDAGAARQMNPSLKALGSDKSIGTLPTQADCCINENSVYKRLSHY